MVLPSEAREAAGDSVKRLVVHNASELIALLRAEPPPPPPPQQAAAAVHEPYRRTGGAPGRSAPRGPAAGPRRPVRMMSRQQSAPADVADDASAGGPTLLLVDTRGATGTVDAWTEAVVAAFYGDPKASLGKSGPKWQTRVHGFPKCPLAKEGAPRCQSVC